MTRGDFVRRWLPVLLWMLVIFTASTDLMSTNQTSRFIGPFLRWLVPEISAAAIAAVQLFVRKAAHLTEYAILAGLLLRALRSASGQIPGSAAVGAFMIAGVCAGLDEFHQSFVPTRTGSPYDVIIDICGVIMGLAIYWVVAQRRPRGARTAECA